MQHLRCYQHHGQGHHQLLPGLNLSSLVSCFRPSSRRRSWSNQVKTQVTSQAPPLLCSNLSPPRPYFTTALQMPQMTPSTTTNLLFPLCPLPLPLCNFPNTPGLFLPPSPHTCSSGSWNVGRPDVCKPDSLTSFRTLLRPDLVDERQSGRVVKTLHRRTWA